jgi:membrane protease subunit HflK
MKPMDFDSREFRDLPWERIVPVATVVMLIVGVLFLVSKGVYRVEAHERAVVLRFGKYHATVDPGLHFCIPLVDDPLKVSLEEHSLRLPFGEGPDRPVGATEEPALMLTADLNAAVVEWTVQWRVVKPEDFLFRLYRENDEEYPRRVITMVARSVMNQLIGDYSIDEILTQERGAIADKAREQTQQQLDVFGCGIAVTDLQMQGVRPPEKVRASFDLVNASIQERDKLENEANKERNQLLPASYAEKDKTIQEARGYAERRRAETQGEIKALLAKYREYEKAPRETRQRLYLEAMEEVLGSVESKVIVDADVVGRALPLLPLLPLDQGATP